MATLRLLPPVPNALPPVPPEGVARHGELLRGVCWPAGPGRAAVPALVPLPLPAAAGFTVPRATYARLVAADRWAGAEVPLPLDAPLPDLMVVGCHPGPPAADPDPMPDYTAAELDQLGLLLGVLRRAARRGDAATLGAVATRGAMLNQRCHPVPLLAELRDVAESSGAVGVQVAHSGTVAGLLYDGADPRAAARADRGRDGLAALGVGRTWVFRPSVPATLARAVGA